MNDYTKLPGCDSGTMSKYDVEVVVVVVVVDIGIVVVVVQRAPQAQFIYQINIIRNKY